MSHRSPAVAALLVLLALSGGCLSAQTPPWHHPLCFDGGGYWHSRLPVEVRNTTAQDLQGAVQEVPIGEGDGALPLAGVAAESLRVCDTQGRELLYDVLDPAGATRRTGRLQNGDRLAFGVACAPDATATYYVYADNAAALAPPDYLRAGLVNGGAEAGRDSPEGWDPVETDAQHVVTWVTTNPHSGQRCFQTTVAPGAEPTWVKWMQANIPVTAGARYELRAWVRAQDVVGSAGWFIHINGAQPQLVNQTLNGGDGTFDWRELTCTVEAPPGAADATIGTVLRGTGTAWFDDVSLVALGGAGQCEVRVGPIERMELAERPADPAWPEQHGPPDENGPWRCRVRVPNFTADTRTGVLIQADLRPIASRLRLRPPYAVACPVAAGEEPNRPATWTGDSALFAADLPPHSLTDFYLYLWRRGLREDWQPPRVDELVGTPGNLIANADFEAGTDWPDGWDRPAATNAAGQTVAETAWDTEAPSGKRSVKMTIPADAPLTWAGWHQKVPVRPNTTYLYAGYLKTEGVDGSVTLYAHILDAEGKWIEQGGSPGTNPVLSGTQNWTRTSCVFRTPPNAATAELHLTMNAHGTVWHDALVLCEVVDADVGPIETPEPPAAEAGPAAWTVDPIIKVFPDDPPGERPERLEAWMARGEYEPVQLVLRSPRELRNVRVSVEAPRHPDGVSLDDTTVNLVGFVPIDHATAYYSSQLPSWYRRTPDSPGASDGWAGEWPDPLPPNRPFDLAPRRAQPVWITVHTNRTAPAGQYEGRVVIQADGGVRMELPLRVHVWDFELPERSHCVGEYDLSSGPDVSAPPGADKREVLRQWYRLFASHRLVPDGFRPQPTFTYENGHVKMDTAAWDGMAAYCLDELKMNTFYTPWEFYALGWAYPPKRYFGLEPFTPEYDAAFTEMYEGFMDHLRERGWHDRVVFYISDEPFLENTEVTSNLARLCKLAQAADPAVPIYSSTWRYSEALVGSITMWGIGSYGCFPVDKMMERRNAGDRLRFTTDGQMCIDTPYCAIERLLPHFCFKYDVEGYEFWGGSWWTYNPWERGWHQYIRQSNEGKDYYYVRYPNGDGYLTYPGRDVGVDGPVSSIRFEQAREGMEDYEYLYLLRERTAAAKAAGREVQPAEALLSRAGDLAQIPNAGGLRSTDMLPRPEAVAELRRELGDQIERLRPPG